MTKNRINLQQHTMYFGTIMGFFWIVKFILFPFGLDNPSLMFLFIALSMTVPYVGYRMARSFRDNICGGSLTFAQSWIFMIFMYFFASMLIAVAHYIYYRFIDNGHLADTYAHSYEQLKAIPGMIDKIEQYPYQEMIDALYNLTPIEITMQLLSSNMLFCSIIALVTAPFVAKKKRVTL